MRRIEHENIDEAAHGPAPRAPPALLALFFLAGVLLGQVLSGRVPDTTGDERGGIWRTTSAWGARERPLSRRLCRPW